MMVLGACPPTHRVWEFQHARLLLALWLGIAQAVPPTRQVSNVQFQDGNSDGGWISGTIRWDPPTNVSGISTYGVVIFNSMEDLTPSLPALPGDFDGAWYLCDLGNTPHAPVGTNDLTITTLSGEAANFPRRGSVAVQPQIRRRYAWGHYKPPDRYIAVACMNSQKEAGPPVVIPIYDKSSLKPIEHLNDISFTDTNSALGVLDGTISWPPGIEGDFTLTKSYSVYLANDDAGTDEVKIGDSNVPTFELTLSGHSRGQRDFIRIRAANDNGVSAWSKSVRLFDVGPSVPSEGVTGLAFTSPEYTEGQVTGTVSWTPPDDEAPISSYRIFLSDQQGVGGTLVPADGYVVPVGTNRFVLPLYTVRNSPDYVQVYSENDKGMQQLPAELAVVPAPEL